MLNAETLFTIYQNKLEYLNREDPENYIAKYTVFSLYQDYRLWVDGGIPRLFDCLEFRDDLPPYVFADTGYTCSCIGILKYRKLELPVYTDSYGCQDFVIYNGVDISVQGMGGEYDWYYELDYHIDNISCKTKE